MATPKKQSTSSKDARVIAREPQSPREKASQMRYLTGREVQRTRQGWRDEARSNAKKRGTSYRAEYQREAAQRCSVSRAEQRAYKRDTGRRTTRRSR